MVPRVLVCTSLCPHGSRHVLCGPLERWSVVVIIPRMGGSPGLPCGVTDSPASSVALASCHLRVPFTVARGAQTSTLLLAQEEFA